MEQWVRKDSMLGIVPQALLDTYRFWRTGPCLIRGYPEGTAIGTQILIVMQPEAKSEDPKDRPVWQGVTSSEIHRLPDAALPADHGSCHALTTWLRGHVATWLIILTYLADHGSSN